MFGKAKILRYSDTFLKDIVLALKADKIAESILLPSEISFQINNADVDYSLHSLFNYLQWSEFDRQGNVWSEGTYSKRFVENLEPGDTVYDIGADHGYYSLLAATAIGTLGRVHAFEPHPTNFEAVSKNCERNGFGDIVTPHNALITDIAGEIEYLTDNNPRQTAEKGAFSIETESIDNFSTDNPIPDVIKIDVQGGECRVLRGAKDIISSVRPTLFVEIHNRKEVEQIGGSWEEIYSLLAEYELTRISDPWGETEAETDVSQPPTDDNLHFIIAR